MLKKAQEVLTGLSDFKQTEEIRIAKKRMREVIQLLTEPERKKKFQAMREVARKAAVEKITKKYESNPTLLAKKVKPFLEVI